MESCHGPTLCFPNYFDVKLEYSENAGFEMRCDDKIKPEMLLCEEQRRAGRCQSRGRWSKLRKRVIKKHSQQNKSTMNFRNK